MESLRKIVVFGGGLAGYMTALALVKRLPETIEIIFAETEEAISGDVFYGSVTSPSTYEFMLNLGISEPELLLGTDTSFSLGTRYEDWGPQGLRWTQAFHQPLPLHHGVKFQHYVNRFQNGQTGWTLDPYIMSVEAANKGVFAHPPEGKNIPLASVEYGYHFATDQWIKLLKNKLQASRCKITNGIIDTHDSQGSVTRSITLQGGKIIEADLFVDCSGQHGDRFEDDWLEKRPLMAMSYDAAQDKLESVVRVLKGTKYGWHSKTPLRGKLNHLHIFPQQDEPEIQLSREGLAPVRANLTLGRSAAPWQGNMIKLGHNAGALEPLTPAPVMMLQHDIDRLVELIPTSERMVVEAREYNRRFVQDFDNAENFNRALFKDTKASRSSYTNGAVETQINTKLTTKIIQFESRGICVLFDNEPFTEQDWTLLHLGMGRRPARYDPLTDRVPLEQISQMLNNMQQAISQMGSKMPPHQIYMARLLKFLKEKHG